MDQVFPFEADEVGSDLALVPLAARRALDQAGFHLPLAGWQSLPFDERQNLVTLGTQDDVDVAAVAAIVDDARPNARLVDPNSDPTPLNLPEGLSEQSGIDNERWANLGGLARYVLAHAARRAVQRHDPSLLTAALEAFCPRHTLPSPDPAPITPPPASRRFYAEPKSMRSEHMQFGVEQKTFTAEPKSIRPERMQHFTPEQRMLVSEKPVGLERTSEPKTMAPGPTTARPPQIISVVSDQKRLSTHIGPSGDVRMVDVADKPVSHRIAIATSRVRMRHDTVDRLLRGDTPKGEVLATARVAGIMAAKRTPELIPMCHAVALSHVEVRIDIDGSNACAIITARAEAIDRTGVEMEAMVAASITALTMYDMLKGIDREMVVEQVVLIEKSGGRSGTYRRSI